jgi:nucleotidyltransferase substrate binding protein (TIGR01987 family)
MKDELTEQFQSCEAALTALAEALSFNAVVKNKHALPLRLIVRDAAMRRFGYSFEATWRLLKDYLDRREGVVCSSPPICFREAMQAGLLSAEETEVCLTMADDCRQAAHAYDESPTATIHARLPQLREE